VPSAGAIVDLTQDLFPRFPDGLSQVVMLGFGHEVVPSVVDLEHYVVSDRSIRIVDPYLGGHVVELVESAVDLLEVFCDPILLGLVQITTGR
jgi:hypothetical protein